LELALVVSLPIIRRELYHWPLPAVEFPLGVAQYRTKKPLPVVQIVPLEPVEELVILVRLNVWLTTPIKRSQKASTPETITGTMARRKKGINPREVNPAPPPPLLPPHSDWYASPRPLPVKIASPKRGENIT